MNKVLLCKLYDENVMYIFCPPAELEREEDGEGADLSSNVVKDVSPTSDNPDQEAIVEALKSICNILLHSETGLVRLLFVS